MNMKLFLIEDELEDAKAIEHAVTEFSDITDESGENWHFVLEHLPGKEEVRIDGKSFRFYTEIILEELQNIIKKQAENEHIGLLLDIVLTNDEYESKYAGSYPILRLAPEIYKRFKRELPIYIITSVSSFYTNSERILGIDLSECFINKEMLTEYKLKSAIDKLQNFFVNWSNDDALSAQK